MKIKQMTFTEPYEAILEDNGYSYHIICGKHQFGHYLVIPNWNIGCEISYYNDFFWNKESISETELDDMQAEAIAYCIKNLETR